MSIEDSHQGALVCKVVLWEPGNFQDDGAKRVGLCFATNTDLELWTEEVEQGVIEHDHLPEALSGRRPRRA